MGKLFTNRILDVTPKERPGEPDGSVHITGLQLHHFHFLSSSLQPLGTLVPRPASPCGYPGGRRAGRGSRGAFLTSRLRGVPGVKRGPSAGQIDQVWDFLFLSLTSKECIYRERKSEELGITRRLHREASNSIMDFVYFVHCHIPKGQNSFLS